MQLNIRHFFFLFLIIFSGYYIFYGHAQNALWANEMFHPNKNIRLDPQYIEEDTQYIEEIEEPTKLPPSVEKYNHPQPMDKMLPPPPQLNEGFQDKSSYVVNKITRDTIVHDHPLHEDTYQYLDDIESSFDGLAALFKSKAPNIPKKTVKLSQGMSPLEYASWQQVLPDVFGRPLIMKDPPPKLRPPAVKMPEEEEKKRPPVSKSRKPQNIITVNVKDNRVYKEPKGQPASEEEKGRISHISTPPVKGSQSFQTTGNNIKLEARNMDDFVGGADSLVERPG